MMKNSMKLNHLVMLPLCALFFFIGTVTVQAATYYVATTGSDGVSCAASTNIATPRLTFKAGVECMTAGDKLYIRAGTYNQQLDGCCLTFPNGTSWDNAPLISAYPGETVLIGQIGVGGTNQYIEFAGFTISAGYQSISVGGTAHHIKFTNMEVKNGFHQCVQIGSSSHHVWFTGGRVHDCGLAEPIAQAGYAFYISTSDNLIENVEIYNVNRYCLHTYEPGPVKAARNIYRYNVFHHCALQSGSSAAILLSSGDSNTAYNNILYSNSGHGIEVLSGTTAKIWNNTIYGGAQTGVLIRTTVTSAFVQNNIIFNNAGGTISDTAGIATKDHNLTTSPLFVNAAAFNFNLQTSSPAIDAGVTLSQVTTDFKQTPRPQGGAYDIGAYEGAGSSDNEPPQRPVGLVIR